ncbi:hypothetical protein D3C71_1578040 [compost metagenome]
MRQQRGRPLRDQARDRRDGDGHFVQHHDIGGRQIRRVIHRLHDTQAALRTAGVQRQERLFAQQRLLRHQGQPGGLRRLLLRRGIRLETHRLVERGA